MSATMRVLAEYANSERIESDVLAKVEAAMAAAFNDMKEGE